MRRQRIFQANGHGGPVTLPSARASCAPKACSGAARFARSLTPELRAELEAELARLVLPHLVGARVVAAYHPLKDEISPLPILAGLGDGQRARPPLVRRPRRAFLWREGPATEPSPWGVLQPPAEAEALAPDVVLVPVVLADRRGTRIGHGKGHYDRALAHLREGGGPVFTIGLAWESQIVDDADPGRPLGHEARRDRDAEGVDRMRARAELAQAARASSLILLLIAGWACSWSSAAALIAGCAWPGARRSIIWSPGSSGSCR